MGNDASKSVVNPEQRSWEHENLFLVGGGSMPSIGTANITLTIAALCYRTAEAMAKQLDKDAVAYVNAPLAPTGDQHVHA